MQLEESERKPRKSYCTMYVAIYAHTYLLSTPRSSRKIICRSNRRTSRRRGRRRGGRDRLAWLESRRQKLLRQSEKPKQPVNYLDLQSTQEDGLYKGQLCQPSAMEFRIGSLYSTATLPRFSPPHHGWHPRAHLHPPPEDTS